MGVEKALWFSRIIAPNKLQLKQNNLKNNLLKLFQFRLLSPEKMTSMIDDLKDLSTPHPDETHATEVNRKPMIRKIKQSSIEVQKLFSESYDLMAFINAAILGLESFITLPHEMFSTASGEKIVDIKHVFDNWKNLNLPFNMKDLEYFEKSSSCIVTKIQSVHEDFASKFRELMTLMSTCVQKSKEFNATGLNSHSIDNGDYQKLISKYDDLKADLHLSISKAHAVENCLLKLQYYRGKIALFLMNEKIDIKKILEIPNARASIFEKWFRSKQSRKKK